MKETYIAPEMEIVRFETEDVITASGGNDKLPTVPFSLNNDGGWNS